MRRKTAGVLLTGGASRRLGTDKARVPIAGRACAEVVGERVAAAVAPLPALEVGPGRSWLPFLEDPVPGAGPLAAAVAGAAALKLLGHDGPVLLVACDLPLVPEGLLRLLAHWPGDRSVVPVVHGRPQVLCARYGREDLERGTEALAAGVRAVRVLAAGAVLLGPEVWGKAADEDAFSDLDTPVDLLRLQTRLGSARSRSGGLG